MTHLLSWGDSSRETLRRELPGALVVLPIGAVEQHGPHLPTRTDIMISASVAESAAEKAVARGSIPIILAPPLPFGISTHHLVHGGTLSLATRTMIAILDDLVDSVEQQGGRRLLIVNGHGGNRGAARAVASGADARTSITVSAVDYWDCAGSAAPGHAGEAETAAVLALAPQLVATPILPRENVPEIASIGPASYHGSWLWRSIDGYTDEPARATAEAGRAFLDAVVDGLADLMIAFGRLPA